MPDIEQILTRLSPGKYDAQRAANFDIGRASGLLQSSLPVQRLLNFNEEERTADFAFASDQPIEHWFGMVILDTDPANVDLSRVENGVCPFLVNHNVNNHCGVVVPGSIEIGPVIRGKVKFSRSALGQEILNDVRDEVRNGTSIGFLIKDLILESDEEGEIPVYRAKKWEMLENSSASIPADYQNVGAGRSLFEKVSEPPSPESRALPTSTEKTMTPEEIAAAEAAQAQRTAAPAVETVTRSAAEVAADEIERWGKRLKCEDLAVRYMTETDEKDIAVAAFKRFVVENQEASAKIPVPSAAPIAGARVDERFTLAPTIGEQLINSEIYRSSVKKGVTAGMRVGFETKGFLDKLIRTTFTSTGTGLDTTVNYLATPIVMLEQQRLTVRDLLPVAETSQAAVVWIKEDTFTNAAAMTAEEGEKPEASFDTGSATATVKKIAVVAKVSDEMWADFPALRDYINTRLRFMVEQVEEDQLLNGSGSGNNITGLMNATGIQSQAKGSDSNLDAIHKAMTKVRVATGTTGGWEPDGIVMHPTDYQLIRLAKDDNNQYFGGGPFYGAYSSGGGVNLMPGPWGLKTVVTTAISAGTALVGAFRVAAQIFQREGIRVDATNTNEDDFNFNRISLRVEERLALAIYRGSALCKVTSIA